MADYKPTTQAGVFTNPAYAFDGDSATCSVGSTFGVTQTQNWYGFSSLSLTGATLTLNVDRGYSLDDPVAAAPPGMFITGNAGNAILYYSLDGGTTWGTLDNQYTPGTGRNTVTLTLSGATLSGKNLSNLRIQGYAAAGYTTYDDGGGGQMTDGVYAEIDIYEITATVITASKAQVSCSPFLFF